MKLFRTVTNELTKQAGLTPLGDNDSMWGSEILAALYKQHKFLGSYDINLQIDGQDETLGFMFGSFIVKNATMGPITSNPMEQPGPAAQDSAGMSQGQPASNEPVVRIPVIVRASKLFSFDVFIDPQEVFQPLTENRLQAALFTTESLKAVMPPAPDEMQESDQAASPGVPNTGWGADTRGSYEKIGFSLEKIAQHIPLADRKQYVAALEADPYISRIIPSRVKLAMSLRKLQTVAEKPIARAESDISCAVLEKVAGGYTLILSRDNHPTPHPIALSNAQAESIPAALRKEAVKLGGVLITSATDTAQEVERATNSVEQVESTGVYAMLTKSGSATKGVVLADIRSMDGRETGLRITVTPEGSSLQTKVAGVRCGDVNLSAVRGEPASGSGVFILADNTVMEPVKIGMRIDRPDGVDYTAITLAGEPCVLKLADVRTVLRTDSGYLVPKDARFMPLHKSATATRFEGVIEEAYYAEKLASAFPQAHEVKVMSDGSRFTFSGGCGVAQLPEAQTHEIKYAHALYNMGILGIEPESAKSTLLTASKSGVATFVGLRDVMDFAKTASKEWSSAQKDLINSLRQDLTKIATALPDEQETVDSVLSLNFITPDTIEGYMEYVPEYEQALSRLAELLIGVRLGVQDVPESAVLASLKGLTKVVDGMQLLGLRQEAEPTQPQV